ASPSGSNPSSPPARPTRTGPPAATPTTTGRGSTPTAASGLTTTTPPGRWPDARPGAHVRPGPLAPVRPGRHRLRLGRFRCRRLPCGVPPPAAGRPGGLPGAVHARLAAPPGLHRRRPVRGDRHCGGRIMNRTPERKNGQGAYDALTATSHVPYRLERNTT